MGCNGQIGDCHRIGRSFARFQRRFVPAQPLERLSLMAEYLNLAGRVRFSLIPGRNAAEGIVLRLSLHSQPYAPNGVAGTERAGTSRQPR